MSNQNDEIMRLKIQSGVLFLHKALDNTIKSGKEKLFRRWKTRVAAMRKMQKLFEAMQRRSSFADLCVIRKSFSTWKEVGAMMISEMIQEELQAVSEM